METGQGLRKEKIYVPALFHADDGMLMATSVGEMERMIEVLVEVVGRYGSCINISKCKSMIFRRRRKENVERIGEIELVRELKYLGIAINDNTQCFRRHKEEKIKQARRMANMTYSVMHKSCNKIMTGKVYWKSVVLPAVLTGASVLCWTRSELEVLQ